jgi:hypothetical protein
MTGVQTTSSAIFYSGASFFPVDTKSLNPTTKVFDEVIRFPECEKLRRGVIEKFSAANKVMREQ